MSAARDGDLDILVADLRGRIEVLAAYVLGEPNRQVSSRRTLRYGSKGSLALEVVGRKRGTWFSHEAGTGGGPLQLIQHARSCSLPEAIDWARSWLGSPPADRPEHKQARPEDAFDADDEAGIAEAQRYVRESRGVYGTVADRYLVETRGIPRPDGGWPAALSYHPRERSLIVAATRDDGTVQAIQRVLLDADAQNQRRDDGSKIKLSRGPQDGAVVRLPGPADGPLLIAEGPETGLSVWRATGFETRIALGAISKMKLPPDRQVMVCADDDPRYAPATHTLGKVLKTWKRAGINVVKVTPWPVARYDKSDFNDVLRESGLDAVCERIERAFQPRRHATARATVADGRKQLDRAVGAFFAQHAVRFLDPDVIPPVQAVKVTVGGGKSETTRQHISRTLIGMRARGDTRSIAIAVPTHALGDEQADKLRDLEAVAGEMQRLGSFKAAGLSVAVWRGMEAKDPDEADETMCRNLQDVQEAREALANPQETVCGSGKEGEAQCPLRAVCAYQKQRNKRADVWIVPHQMIFQRKPKAIGDLAALVVDEAAWRAGMEGAVKEIELPLDHFQTAHDGGGLDGERLRFLRGMMLNLLRRHPDGPLQREALEAAGFDTENTGEAHGLEWRRKIDANMKPGMTRAERKAAVDAAAANSTVRSMARLWHAARHQLREGGAEGSGWVTVGTNRDGQCVAFLRGRREIAAGWQVPTLLIDAVLDVNLVRPFWPQVEMAADISIATPHQRVRQVVDRAFAKAMLAPLNEEDAAGKPDEASKRERALDRLHAILMREARQYRGSVLIVCQKAVEEALKGRYRLRPNMMFAHHNAVAGRDEWRDAAALIVVGRTLPSPQAVENMAAALSGSAVPLLRSWYERADADRELADGNAIAAEANRHPDPLAEAIRWQICEGELVQIIGRGRGVNRTADNPLDVLVLTDVPLPLPVDETLSDADLTPTPIDRMLAYGGVAFVEPAQASRAYPKLWRNREAAKKAFQRGEVGDISVLGTLYTGMSPSSRVRFQLAGAGHKPAEALVDLDLVPAPRAWLEDRLGLLAMFEIIDRPDPPPARKQLHTGMKILPPSDPPPINTGPDPEALPPAQLYSRRCLIPPPTALLFVAGRRIEETSLAIDRATPALAPPWLVPHVRGAPEMGQRV